MKKYRVALEVKEQILVRIKNEGVGVLITSAATLDVDVAPMEGFDPQKFDDILGLGKLDLETKVAVAIGFRASDDASAQYKKVRFAKKDVVIEVK